MKLKEIIKKGYSRKHKDCKKILTEGRLVLKHFLFHPKDLPCLEVFITYLFLNYYKAILTSSKFKENWEIITSTELYRCFSFPWTTAILILCFFYCNPFLKLKKQLTRIYADWKFLSLHLKFWNSETKDIEILGFNFNFYYSVIYFITGEALRFKAK